MELSLVFITCKRKILFEKTVESLLQNCKDLSLIKNIIMIDDNSDIDDFIKMKNLMLKFDKPFFAYTKYQEQKGHIQSLNMMFDLVKEDYLFCCEDDWLFTRPGHFIRESFEIMDENPDIKQVLLRTTDIMAVNQKVRQTKESKIDFIKYDYPGQFARDSKNRPAWPNANLNPAIWNFKSFKQIGKFPIDECNFEFKWSRKCWKEGIKIAYFPENYCEHLGEGQSAYIKNGTRK